MDEFIVALGARYLTCVAGSDSWSPNRVIAFGFRDRDVADKTAERINGLKLGHNKARVLPRAEAEA